MALKAMTWDYVAGFFDGEGCVYVQELPTGAIRAKVAFCQSVKQADVLLDIGEFLTEGGYHPYLNNGSKDSMILWLHRMPEVYEFLKQTLPLLRVKHIKAMEVIETLDGYTPRLHSNRKRMVACH